MKYLSSYLERNNILKEDSDVTLDQGLSIREYESALLNNDLLTEQALLEAESECYRVPYHFSLPKQYTVNERVVTTFPISYLKKHFIIPLRDEENNTYLAGARYSSRYLMNDITVCIKSQLKGFFLLPQAEILRLINKTFGEMDRDGDVEDIFDGSMESLSELEDERIEDLLDETNDAPFIKLVNTFIAQAVQAGASDIHVEPYRDILKVRFRLDGVLYDKHVLNKKLHAAVVSRIKIMAKLNIAEKRLPQDGRIALALGGRKVDLRVSTLPTSFGERAVLRLLEKGERVLTIEELGVGGEDLKTLQNLMTLTHGIILVTGPTGSGKTTSLYAVLNEINSPEKNILTIEDPVEYELDGVGQIQVNQKVGLTFSEGLRSIVRQDPDVILIGEIRDKETADIAVQSALTGHLVFSTLHTNDAPSAVTRLFDMGVEPFLLSSVIRAVIAQRLVRLLCPHCKEAFIPDDGSLKELGDNAMEMLSGQTVYRAVGCNKCLDTGYKGRKAIYEVMSVSDSIKRLISNSVDSNTIRDKALEEKIMSTLQQDGYRTVLKGLTSLTEVKRVTNL
ncbi:MAG: type II secretion system ATPase GspE [Desulfovibrio sp.]